MQEKVLSICVFDIDNGYPNYQCPEQLPDKTGHPTL